MNHFEIIGWDLSTLAAASEKALAVIGTLAGTTPGYSFQAHFWNLKDAWDLATAIPNGRYSHYCWRPIGEAGDWKKFRSHKVMNARLVFGDDSVSIEYGQAGYLPPYDWDGAASSLAVVRLTQRHRAPLSSANRDYSPEIVKRLAFLGTRYFGNNPPKVNTLTEWLNEGRNHHYLVNVPVCDAMRFVEGICAEFDLSSGIGTFEISGSPGDLEAIISSTEFRSADFPAVASNLNPRKSSFALEPNSFFVPVCNVSSTDLGSVARLRDGMGERIVYTEVMRRYLSWQLPNGRMSPKVQGNYLLISEQKSGGYAISLGFERYEDKDPTARQFTSFAAPIIEGMGAHLKKVTAPR